MSWFKRRPTLKNPPERISRRVSPTVERLLKETKESTKPTIIPKESKK
jgi:hypothetical protein